MKGRTDLLLYSAVEAEIKGIFYPAIYVMRLSISIICVRSHEWNYRSF